MSSTDVCSPVRYCGKVGALKLQPKELLFESRDKELVEAWAWDTIEKVVGNKATAEACRLKVELQAEDEEMGIKSLIFTFKERDMMNDAKAEIKERAVAAKLEKGRRRQSLDDFDVSARWDDSEANRSSVTNTNLGDDTSSPMLASTVALAKEGDVEPDPFSEISSVKESKASRMEVLEEAKPEPSADYKPRTPDDAEPEVIPTPIGDKPPTPIASSSSSYPGNVPWNNATVSVNTGTPHAMGTVRKSVSRTPTRTPVRKEKLGIATASLVCGIIGLFFFGIVLGPIAICLACSAASKIQENPAKYGDSKCSADTGMCLGIVDVIGWIVVVVFFF